MKGSYLSLEEARELLYIDIEDMFTECQKQGESMYNIGERYANALSKRDLAEFDREKILTELLNDEYEEATANKVKLTKDEATARVKIKEEFIEANEEYLEYKKEAKEWEHLTEAIKIKTSMIKKLVELILANLGGDISLSIAKAVGTRGQKQIDRFNMNIKRKECAKRSLQRRS